MKIAWILSALPAAAGGVVAFLVVAGWIANPTIHLQAGMGALALLLGGLLSALAFAATGGAVWLQARGRRAVQQAESIAAADHRRFLERLDHELKNPLAIIRAQLANLLNGSATDRQRDIARVIDANVMRLSTLTADLRALADLETYEPAMEPVDIAGLLGEAITAAAGMPGANQRQLTRMLPKAPRPLPSVRGEYDLLLMAVQNLLINALKFTRPGDAIEVRASEDGTWVHIVVADTGPGISAEDLPHVGEELYRGESARGLPGRGLGLAMARLAVERHGGRLQVRSPAGKGTEVTLRLPINGRGRSR